MSSALRGYRGAFDLRYFYPPRCFPKGGDEVELGRAKRAQIDPEFLRHQRKTAEGFISRDGGL